MQICELDSIFQSIWYNRCAYILLFRFLDKKGFPIVSKLHVQVDWLSVHFNVNLEEFDTSTLITAHKSNYFFIGKCLFTQAPYINLNVHFD